MQAAHSCSAIAKVTLPHSVGRIERQHPAIVVHMPCQLANGKLGKLRFEDVWILRWGKIVRFSVQVLMGDFNMPSSGSYQNSAVTE